MYEEKIKEMKAVIGELTLQKIALEKHTALWQKEGAQQNAQRGASRHHNQLYRR
jgi:predicted transcriptional regulator